VSDYFEDAYLLEWRAFIQRLNKSQPFLELWQQCCMHFYGKIVVLQLDTPTRWSSTVNMLAKGLTVMEAVERMLSITRGTDHNVFSPPLSLSLSRLHSTNTIMTFNYL
jgi:hypothetical protein